MKKSNFRKGDLPDAPGVYFFLGANKKILYIGKATSLRNRVLSYFSNDIKEKRSPLIAKMVSQAKSVEFTVTDSVLEALLLETNLIKTHRPVYNTRSKDDKSYNHLIITDENLPRVLVVRGKDIKEGQFTDPIKYSFGPFPNSLLFKEALKLVRKLFTFYDTKNPVQQEKSKLGKGKIDFNRQIGLYPDNVSKRQYTQTIMHIRYFFEGKKQRVIKDLEREMLKLAKAEKFEEANLVKKRIFALQHIQDISLLKNERHDDSERVRIEAYDIAHLQGQQMIGVMVVFENGEPQKSEYRKFNIKSLKKSNDPAALAEVLERRIKHEEWKRPEIIVVDGAQAQKNAAEKVLTENQISVPAIAVVKDEHHQPKALLGNSDIIKRHQPAILHANAESHRFALSAHRRSRGADFIK